MPPKPKTPVNRNNAAICRVIASLMLSPKTVTVLSEDAGWSHELTRKFIKVACEEGVVEAIGRQRADRGNAASKIYALKKVV